ncbi:MAG: septum formation initiator family protein [Roseivirga sp.]
MKVLDRIPKPLKNFYVLLGTFFLVWMLFIDSNDFVSQYRLSSELNSLRSQKEYYQDKKVEVIKDREELTTNQRLLEKFARENYLMKKPSEDVYVVVQDD